MSIPSRLAFLAALLSLPHAVFGVELSASTRIASVLIRDDFGFVRIEVEPNIPPGSCASGGFVDIRYDSPDRTAAEQQELLNMINLALIGRRLVRLYLLEPTDPDPCSSFEGGTSFRVAIGLIVQN